MKLNAVVMLFVAANAAQAGPIGMRHTNGVNGNVNGYEAYVNGIPARSFENKHRAEPLLINTHGHDDKKADGIDLEALGSSEVTKSDDVKHGNGEVNGFLSPLSNNKCALGAPEVTKFNGAKPAYGEVNGFLSPLPITKRPLGASEATKSDGVKHGHGEFNGFLSPLPITKRAPGASVVTVSNDPNYDNDTFPLKWNSTKNRAHHLKMSLEQRQNNKILLRDDESELKSITKRWKWRPSHWCWMGGEVCTKTKRDNFEAPASYNVNYISPKSNLMDAIGTLGRWNTTGWHLNPFFSNSASFFSW